MVLFGSGKHLEEKTNEPDQQKNIFKSLNYQIMKAQLNTIVTNKKGNEPKHNLNIGRISTKIEGASNGSISIDAFEGQGDTYRRRKDANIEIYFGGLLQFNGTLSELIEKIK